MQNIKPSEDGHAAQVKSMEPNIAGGNHKDDGFSIWAGFRAQAAADMRDGDAEFDSDKEADILLAAMTNQLMAECMAGFLLSKKSAVNSKKDIRNALRIGRLMRAHNMIEYGREY